MLDLAFGLTVTYVSQPFRALTSDTGADAPSTFLPPTNQVPTRLPGRGDPRTARHDRPPAERNTQHGG